MGSPLQLIRSFRRVEPVHRRNEQAVLPDRVAWVVFAVSVACRSALTTAGALLLWSILPVVAGFQTSVVMSGSMAPSLQVGDAVVVRKIDSAHLDAGQILLFDDPDEPGRLRMHRLVSVEEGGLVTKGDANGTKDTTQVPFDSVRGAAFLRIPFAGLPEFWFRTGQIAPLVATGVIGCLLYSGMRLSRLLEDPASKPRRRHRGVKRPARRRAVVTSVVLLATAASVPLVQTSSANATYMATSSNGANTWATRCGDVTPNSGATPSLYYGYGAASPSITDLSASGDTGVYRSGATRNGCTNGWSPYVSFNGTSGVVNTSGSRNHPGAVTIATWFKVNAVDAGGVLVDFGNSNTATASGFADDALYMGDTGTLTFTSATTQTLSLVLTGYQYCTTASGYADGQWHLVVATLSTTPGAAGCAITVDAKPSTTVATSYNITISLGAFAGDWRLGYDSLPSGLTNAPTRAYFKGSLDETQIYDSALVPPTVAAPGVQGAIFASGHGGTIN